MLKQKKMPKSKQTPQANWTPDAWRQHPTDDLPRCRHAHDRPRAELQLVVTPNGREWLCAMCAEQEREAARWRIGEWVERAQRRDREKAERHERQIEHAE